MQPRPLQFAIDACGGQPHSIDPHINFQRVCTDTRKLQPGDLFVALRGENFDGNQFAPAAIAAGASLRDWSRWSRERNCAITVSSEMSLPCPQSSFQRR